MNFLEVFKLSDSTYNKLKYIVQIILPAWKQPTGSQDAYKIGDKVIYKTKTYQSLINANTWSPEAYPAGWKLI